MTITQEELDLYVAGHLEETRRLVETLCRIPAPLGRERARAEFCKQWLESHGAETVHLDEADNAVLELNARDKSALTLFTAHTDTVFPDTAPFEPVERDGNLFCPGVCDDTANLAVLLMAARFLLERGLRPANGLVIAANSGEEGLGNLKGCRQLMETYRGRVARLISFDGYEHSMWNQAVGSRRYQVTVRTPGGHSFRDFGSPNAIAELGRLLDDLYAISPRQGPAGSTTTYNVGTISGGTSVNAIAQEASMLYEYRSDAAEALEGMEQAFQAVLASRRDEDVEITAELLGTRPCAGSVDPAAQRELTELCAAVLKRHTGREPHCESGSTDCNIPLSLGIPAVSFGLCNGDGAHTREEWLEIASLERGLRIALDILLQFAF